MISISFYGIKMLWLQTPRPPPPHTHTHIFHSPNRWCPSPPLPPNKTKCPDMPTQLAYLRLLDYAQDENALIAGQVCERIMHFMIKAWTWHEIKWVQNKQTKFSRSMPCQKGTVKAAILITFKHTIFIWALVCKLKLILLVQMTAFNSKTFLNSALSM